MTERVSQDEIHDENKKEFAALSLIFVSSLVLVFSTVFIFMKYVISSIVFK
jgi:hypothetical protein